MRRGFCAWMLFALACLLPGWWRRDQLAAELQLRIETPLFSVVRSADLPGYRVDNFLGKVGGPLGCSCEWRRLRPPGEDVLLANLACGNCVRRLRAARLLWLYQDRPATLALVAAVWDPDARVAGAALLSLDCDPPVGRPWRVIGMEFSDEEAIDYLHRPNEESQRSQVISALRARGVGGMSLLATLLSGREGKSLAIDADASIYHTFTEEQWRTPEIQLTLLNAIAAGFTNPDAEVRESCAGSYDIQATRPPLAELHPLLTAWDRKMRWGIPWTAEGLKVMEDESTALVSKDDCPDSARCVVELTKHRLPREAQVRVLRAGLSNPNAEIRQLCADHLAVEEEQHGDK